MTLRGRVFTLLHATRKEKRTLDSAEELVSMLRESFDLDVPEAADLWPAVCARHAALFAR